MFSYWSEKDSKSLRWFENKPLSIETGRPTCCGEQNTPCNEPVQLITGEHFARLGLINGAIGKGGWVGAGGGHRARGGGGAGGWCSTVSLFGCEHHQPGIRCNFAGGHRTPASRALNSTMIDNSKIGKNSDGKLYFFNCLSFVGMIRQEFEVNNVSH